MAKPARLEPFEASCSREFPQILRVPGELRLSCRYHASGSLVHAFLVCNVTFQHQPSLLACGDAELASFRNL